VAVGAMSGCLILGLGNVASKLLCTWAEFLEFTPLTTLTTRLSADEAPLLLPV
jgi:hypothetical protein